MAYKLSALLATSVQAVTSASEKTHPFVGGSANIITLDTRNTNDFFGSIFIGDQYVEERMVYDTASQNVALAKKGTKNAEVIGLYDTAESKTAKAFGNEELELDYGSFFLNGKYWRDNMCLIQNRQERTNQSGRLCVRSMPFLSITWIDGPFMASGLVGLAPGGGEYSYVEQLHEQGVIESKVVGLNFEDPQDKNIVSSITFGFVDYDEIQRGKDGFNFYNNNGTNNWSLDM